MSEAAPAIAVTATEGQAPVVTSTDANAQPTSTDAKNDAPKQEAPPAAETKPTDAPKLWSDPAKVDADGKPVDGDTPPVADPKDWFMRDKFPNEIEQAKAYPELLKKMGKNWGAPKDDYVLDGIEGVSKDDLVLQNLKPALKELGLSQDGFAHLIKSYQDAQVAMAKHIEKEVTETLLRNDALTVKAVDQWLNTAFEDEDRKTIQSWIMGVDDFRILNVIRTMLPADTSVPSSTAGNAAKFETLTEVENEKIKYRKEVSSGLRVEDSNYANELQQRWKDAYTRDSHAKAMGKRK